MIHLHGASAGTYSHAFCSAPCWRLQVRRHGKRVSAVISDVGVVHNRAFPTQLVQLEPCRHVLRVQKVAASKRLARGVYGAPGLHARPFGATARMLLGSRTANASKGKSEASATQKSIQWPPRQVFEEMSQVRSCLTFQFHFPFSNGFDLITVQSLPWNVATICCSTVTGCMHACQVAVSVPCAPAIGGML